ncbi:MAG: hypothetical protein V4538_15150 [Bacteroidota bacterium]
MKIDLIQTPFPDFYKKMIGNKYGRLVVIEYAGSLPSKHRKHGVPYIKCKCDCGNIVTKCVFRVWNGDCKSCGCLQREMGVEKLTTHGQSYTVEYKTWEGVKKRCLYPKSENYYLYGGAGIKICKGWLGKDGYINFKNDMGNKPTPLHSIDRIYSDKHYSCGHCKECKRNKWDFNCRWATSETQSNNTSRNKYVYIEGEKLSYRQAERKLGFGRGILWSRINNGWSVEEAIRVFPSYNNKKIKRK